MFSFHKPKIYRSLLGCCICRAKSSSSRFTDSQRYECDFDKCFGVDEPRAGEICNACVLLVKRWKKLPTGSNRNWHHVVDARAGPGTKSMYKIKNRTKDMPEDHSIMKKKHKHKHKHRKTAHAGPVGLLRRPASPSGYSDDITLGDEGFSDHYMSRTPSPGNSDVSDDEDTRSRKSSSSQRRKQTNPRGPSTLFSSFLDLTYWKQTAICCGTIFRGTNGEVMVDPRLLRPCQTCKPCGSMAAPTSTQPTRSPHTRKHSESCASSDSGVSTPALDADDLGCPGTPPPPTLEPELPACSQGATLYPAPHSPSLLDDDMEDDYMPQALPQFPRFAANSPLMDPITAEAAAAAAAVLDLSLGARRKAAAAMETRRFIPLEV